MAATQITIAQGRTAPAATYARQLLDGATKYGVTVSPSGRYLLKTGTYAQAPADVAPTQAYFAS